jgi:hypothetical protein
MITWGNAAGGDWNTAANWQGGVVPGINDDAVIPDFPGSITITHSSGTSEIHSLTDSETLQISGGSFQIDSASTANTIAQSGGTLTGAGNLTVSGSYTWTGGAQSGAGETILGSGAVMTITGGNIVVTAGRTIDDTATGAAINWTSGEIFGTLNNPGQLTLNNPGNIFLGGTLNNSGTITWTGGGAFWFDGGTLNNQAGGTADVQGSSAIDLYSGTPQITNAGTFEKTAGTGSTTVGVAFTDSGTVAAKSGTLNLGSSFSNFSASTLTGGTYLVTATLSFAGANIQTNAATIVLDGSSSQILNSSSSVDALANFATNSATGSFTIQNGRNLTTAASFTNAGTLTVEASSNFKATGNYSQTSGDTDLQGGTLTATGLADLQGGLLSGSGAVSANVNNAAQVGPGDSPGTISINGNYTQTSSGALNLELGGTSSGQFDRLVVSGAATLGGTLNVSLINGFLPAPPQSFHVLTFASRSGDFATETGLALGGGLKLSPSYDATSLTLITLPGPTTTSVTSSAAPSVFGQAVTFTATISLQAPGPPDPTGTIEFFDGATELGSGTVSAGSAYFTTSSLAVATHAITAQYLGDTNFTGSTSSQFSQVVNQAATATALAAGPNPSTFGDPVTLTATVTVVAPGAGSPTGSVEFFDGANPIGITGLSGNQATMTTTTLAVGVHTLTAQYLGDGNFAVSTSDGVSMTINPATSSRTTTTSLSSSANPSVFGQSVTFSATVTPQTSGAPTPTGMVSFLDGGAMMGTGVLDGTGTATFTTATLSLGGHSITAEYAGDGNSDASSSPALTQVVNQASTTTALSAIPSTSVFGQSVQFTATVAPVAPGSGKPTGSVAFKDGAGTIGTGTLDGTGTATFTTSALAVGGHTITAVYDGDTNFITSTSASVGETVNQASTTTALSANPTTSVFGQSVLFTATVAPVAPGSGNPTGSVTFKDGATTIGNGTLDGSGTATFTTSALAVGGHTITAVYDGDTNFVTSTSASASETVDQASTTTALSANPTTSVFGQSVLFAATVAPVAPGSGNPTGSVTFKDGATTIGTRTLDGSGTATFMTSALAVGGHTITAVYDGDTNFDISTSASVSETVDQASTTTSSVSSANPATTGQSIFFTATIGVVAPGSGSPGGTVQFSIDGTPFGSPVSLVGDSAVSPSISTLSGGSHTVSAAYGGDTDFLASTSPDLTQVIEVGVPTTTALSVTLNPSVYGQAITFQATVAGTQSGHGTPTGLVDFMDGSTLLGAVALNTTGHASFRTKALAPGSHAVTAGYVGDAVFAGSTSAVLTQVVNPDATTVALTSSKNPSVFGQPVTFQAAVKPVAPGSGVPTGLVTFYDGAIALGTGMLDTLAHATFTIGTLSVGTHSITAVYGGDPTFTISTSALLNQTVNQAKSKGTLTSSLNPAVFGQAVTFTVTITAVSPGSGTPTGSVTFIDGATAIGSGTLDSTGAASFTTSSLAVGTHSITAVYSGDAGFLASTSNAVKERVTQAKTATALASSLNPSPQGTPVTFTATIGVVAPGAGVPSGTVSFRDGSRVLGTAALTGGVASFTTSTLTVGTHPITAVYSSDASFAGGTSAVLDQVVQTAGGAVWQTLAPHLVDQVLGTLLSDGSAAGAEWQVPDLTRGLASTLRRRLRFE